MSHNTGKVLMGTTRSNHREAVAHKGVIAAGTVVRRKSDGTLSVIAADGEFYGISLGRDLSNAGYSSILTRGLGVPVILTDGLDPAIGAVMSVSDTTGFAGTGTATAAVFASERIGGTGVNGGEQEDGTTVGAAYVDMPGGL